MTYRNFNIEQVLPLSEETQIKRAILIASDSPSMLPVRNLILGPDFRQSNQFLNKIAPLQTNPVKPQQVLYLLQESPQFGDLHSLLRERNSPIPENQARILFAQIVKGVREIHANGGIFGELKLSRVFFADRSRYIHL